MTRKDLTSNSAGIYVMRFPNGMKYVGCSVSLLSRINQHKQLKANSRNTNSMYDYLATINFDDVNIDFPFVIGRDSLNEDDLKIILNILEVKYISVENSIYPNGYNKTIGGEMLGIPDEYRGLATDYAKYGEFCKPILIYDDNGYFVNEYRSIGECSNFLGIDTDDVKRYCSKNILVADKYFFRYKIGNDFPKQIEIIPENRRTKIVVNKIYQDIVSPNRIVSNPGRIIILKYDLDGNFVAEYPSIRSAADSVDADHIFRRNKVFKGFIFLEKDGEIANKIDPSPYILKSKRLQDKEKAKLKIHKPLTSKKHEYQIARYTLRGEYVDYFENIREAAECTGIRYSSIWQCLEGRTKRAGEFRFIRVDEIIKD